MRSRKQRQPGDFKLRARSNDADCAHCGAVIQDGQWARRRGKWLYHVYPEDCTDIPADERTYRESTPLTPGGYTGPRATRVKRSRMN